MTTEPYVPTVEVVRDAVAFPRERLGEPRPISRGAFDRFVAKIRAEAWDEGQEAGWGEAQEQWVISGMVGDLYKHSTTPNPHRAQEASND